MYEHMLCGMFRQVSYCYHSLEIVLVKEKNLTPLFLDDLCVLAFVGSY
jgi:hypothetical protein